MLFTFADLDPRRKAEMALRQSEERFAKSFRLSPVPATICMLDGLKVIEANEAYTKITGYAEQEIVGRSSAELGVWPDRATRERFKQAIDKEASATLIFRFGPRTARRSTVFSRPRRSRSTISRAFCASCRKSPSANGRKMS
jgi:PAS domain S-box-containing protein